MQKHFNTIFNYDLFIFRHWDNFISLFILLISLVLFLVYIFVILFSFINTDFEQLNQLKRKKYLLVQNFMRYTPDNLRKK